MAKYREVGRLAEGGMAIIAQAERDDGVTVVIKRVRPPFCFDPSFLRLFADEGAVHAALDHENIVHLLDKGEDEGGPFLVFEHVDGTDLGIVLEATKAPLDVECVLAVALPLFKALAFAHESALNVVHRDVSPGNVLIGKDGCVKLADFGVASFSLKTEATVAGEMKGKFAYMAPEQSRGEKAGPRADLFAAGVVLWEALAGKRLFDGPTDADVVAAVRTLDAPRLPAPVPAALADLVAQLLEKDPDRRPASSRDVVKRLHDLALELGFDEGLMRHAARLARSAPEREINVDDRRRTQRVMGAEPLARRRRAPVVPLAAAGAVVVVVVAVAFALRPDTAAGVEPRVTQLPPSPVAPIAPSTAPPTAPTASATPSSTAPTASISPTASTAPTSSSTAPTPSSTAPTLAATLPVVPHLEAKASPRVGEASKATSTGTSAKDVKGGEVREVKLASAKGTSSTASLAASAASAAAKSVGGFGRLSVNSEPWAQVWIDGKLVKNETPATNVTLPAGKHVLRLVNPTFKLEKTLEVDVIADTDTKKIVDLNR